MSEPTDVIRLYLDDDKEPFKTARPPLRFQFSTLHLADGPHLLRVEAHNGLAGASIKEIPFHVRNGVAITVSGIAPQQEIAGQVGVIINAYAGNTEVDFEPSRAETPQPVPTWAWLIFLAIVAWTMFYVLNPASRPAAAASTGVSASLGQRVYVDVCAKCHGEDGKGDLRLGTAPLVDSAMVLTADPTDLVSWVVGGPVPDDAMPGASGEGTGRPRMKMLSFGPPRLRPAELVGALNYARNHWGNQAPPIEPTTKRAPAAIRALDEAVVRAVQAHDYEALGKAYALERTPRLVRRHLDAVDVDVSSTDSVVEAYRNWLVNVSELNSVDLQQVAYASMEEDTVVYAHGRVVLTATMRDAGPARAFDGEFVRVYVKEPLARDAAGRCVCDEDKVPILVWRIAFDFATTPMPIGCPPGREGEICPAVDEGRLGYPEVQAILAGLNQKATQAPHGNFWELPHAQFVALAFPYKPIPGATIRLVNLDPALGIRGADTNLVKALRDGRDVIVDVPGKPSIRVDIERMPKNASRMSPVDIGRLIHWLDHGHPESAPKSRTSAAATGAGPGPGPGPDPAAGTAAGTGWGFAEVVSFLEKLQPKAGAAPHKEFWKLPYAQFLAFEFPIHAENATARLVEPGKPERSNLLLAMRLQPMIVRKADGSEAPYDLGRPMPPRGKGARPGDAELARLEAWIVAGCPERAGGAGAPPASGAGSTPPPSSSGGSAPPPPPPPPPPAPPPVSAPSDPNAGAPPPPPPPPPPAPVPGSGDLPPPPPPPAPAPDAAAAPAAGPTTGAPGLAFADVVALIEGWKPKSGAAPHKDFWKLPYAQFVAFQFPVYAENGTARLVVPGDPDKSNLVRALERRPMLVVRDADGSVVEYDVGKPMPPPGKGSKPKPHEIEAIRRWIADGCPEKR